MKKIEITANAKINLTLDIKGKRTDGYHEVEMIMQSVSLADEIAISLSGTGETQVTCDNPRLPQGSGNLAYRAAECYLAAHGIKNPGLSIAIKKRIPAAAGLAGGSADAAAVLLGLDSLLGGGDGALESIALMLGADVPFCLRGGTMLARGVGELLTPLPPMPGCQIVIAKPSEAVSTAEAYAAYDSLGFVARPDTHGMCAALQSGRIADVAGRLCNVMEPAAALPVIAGIKAGMLGHGALGACMSGSGSAVFGLFDDAAMAGNCLAGLKKIYREVFLCGPAAAGCKIL